MRYNPSMLSPVVSPCIEINKGIIQHFFVLYFGCYRQYVFFQKTLVVII